MFKMRDLCPIQCIQFIIILQINLFLHNASSSNAKKIMIIIINDYAILAVYHNNKIIQHKFIQLIIGHKMRIF